MLNNRRTISKMFLLVCILFVNLLVVNASETKWEVLGTTGFIKAWARPAIVVDSNSTPYVAYISINPVGTFVKKFDGSKWVLVGDNNISTNNASDIAIAIDDNDNLFVLYGDYAQRYKLTVSTFSKNARYWETVGSAGFSDAAVSNARTISITMDKSGVPYVAYLDKAHENKATVKKYNATGNSWNTVGVEGFSAALASNITVALDSNGAPYVSYEDNDSKAIVMKFDGTTWNLLDSSVSPSSAWDVSMAIDSKGVPYVGFRDWGVSPPRASVVKYNEPNWDFVGDRGFPMSFSPYPMIALDEQDVLYAVFSDHAKSWKASVMKFDGVDWNYLGVAGFSKDSADETRITVRNAQAYVLYNDYSADSNWTVMKYTIPEMTNMGITPIINYLLD